MNLRTRTDLLLPITLVICALAIGMWMVRRSLEGLDPGNKLNPGLVRTSDPTGDSLDRISPPENPPTLGPDLSTAALDVLADQLALPHARPNEALLTFADPAALAKFLTRATEAGVEVTGPFDGALTLRIGFPSFAALRDLLAGKDGETPGLSANFHVGIPDLTTPPPAGGTGTAPFEAGLLPSLGIEAGNDRMNWGAGVTVAVIDSGISPHPAFRDGQITHLDLTSGGDDFNSHGTAMASLVAGSIPGAEGLAPGADLLDLRIAGKDGLSDSFLLAQAIQVAIDRGADVINISMATYGDARPVAEAVAEAVRRGITVVAAVGNDAAGTKAWPAAYPGVISVSGVAADGSLAYFSNSGRPTLAAPSVGVPSAYHDGASALLAIGNGTSQAAALVSGAAAAFRSRGLDVTTALTRNARPGSGRKEEIGAGILHLPPLNQYRPVADDRPR
jgi:hypothetical protein